LRAKKASMELPEALDLDSSHVMPSSWDQPTPHNSFFARPSANLFLFDAVFVTISKFHTPSSHLQTALKQSVAFHCCTPNVSQVRVICQVSAFGSFGRKDWASNKEGGPLKFFFRKFVLR